MVASRLVDFPEDIVDGT
ncbi:hypothetical protein HID58_037724 [Brassica napus]|uniref:Uncharacterized protein n=1 Tax=Brassica napus TaxID=3708 RepID=A0ABQ8BM85_BRANA|nr:hypothetical protein HID58_037724 [Brassica napus]